uniref:ATP synthase complex subunit 8 n=1 Tax=Ceraclea indistincta TaxID=2904887 RepID=A0A9E8RTR1_9NEOP|nr:ATP synthase F0 subunit 8 [Ceraclea indistincta]UZZ43821.1 ATP synthase F0 subunit 8 [Ceraclea indistincta]
MPQMMPLNWFYLYLLFFFTFLIFLIMIYYNQMPMISNSNNLSSKFIKLNNIFFWKW